MPRLTKYLALLILNIILLASSSVVAQTPSIAWSYKNDNSMLNYDYPVDIVVNEDGLLVVASEEDGINVYDDRGKFDAQYFGNEKTIVRVLKHPVNGYFAAGDSTRMTLPPASQAWVAHLNDNFEVVWQYTYGGSYADDVKSMCLTSDGGLLIGGRTQSSDGDLEGAGADEVTLTPYCWLMKLDSLGNKQWTKKYGNLYGDQTIFKVFELPEGDYLFVGNVHPGEENIDAPILLGNQDIWVVRTDAEGNIKWQKTYGGPSEDGGRDAILTNDGDLFVSGWSNSREGDVPSPYTDKFSSNFFFKVSVENGRKIWANAIGTNSFTRGCAIPTGEHLAIGPDGNVIIGATLEGDLSLLNIDPMGQEFKGREDFWILNIDQSNGKVLWHKTLGGNHIDRISSITLTKGNQIIAIGASKSWRDDVIYPDQDSLPVNYTPWIVALYPCPYYFEQMDTICSGNSFLFFGKEYDTSGRYEQTFSTSYGCDSTYVLNLHVDGYKPDIQMRNDTLFTDADGTLQWLRDGIIILGETNNYFIPIESGGYSVVNTTAFGCSDTSSVIAHEAPKEALPSEQLIVYPNPAKNDIIIEWRLMESGASIALIDASGRIHQTIKTNTAKVVLSLSALSSGLYLIKVETPEASEVVKFDKIVE